MAWTRKAKLEGLFADERQRQRFQQLFFPDGIAFDGKGFVGTRVTAPAFSYLRGIETGNERMVDQILTSWNRIADWVRQIDGLHQAPSTQWTGHYASTTHDFVSRPPDEARP